MFKYLDQIFQLKMSVFFKVLVIRGNVFKNQHSGIFNAWETGHCVYVCVCLCVCLCVCVCVCVFFHREDFFGLQGVRNILEGHGSTILCCQCSAGCLCQGPSFPNIRMWFFNSKDENPSEHELERKRLIYLAREKKNINWYRI